MSNIKVCVKIRPLSEPDKLKKEQQWEVSENGSSVKCVNTLTPSEFTFDHVFDTKTKNSEVYELFVKPFVDSCLDGFNSTVLTYGPTTSGKTYTMFGTDEVAGIIMITIKELFKTDERFHRKIRLGYIEIYKEQIYDLLNDREQVLFDRQQDDVSLSNEEIFVENMEKARHILLECFYKRVSAKRDDSKLSSLSHTILRITVESEDKSTGKIQISHLRYVHVAGSEQMATVPLSNLLNEDSNKSLYSFNAVIDGLSKGEQDISFKNSVLTSLLRESLVGKSNTAIICNVRADEVKDTISTLKFVNQAKNIRTFPIRNELRNVRGTSFRSATPPDEVTTLVGNQQLKDISDTKVENSFLRKELDDEKASFAAKTIWFEEQIKNAEFAQLKLEHRLIKEMTDLKSKMKVLTDSNEFLMGKLKAQRAKNTHFSSRKSSESSTLSQNENSNLTTNGVKYVSSRQRDTGIKRKVEQPKNGWEGDGKKPKRESRATRADVKLANGNLKPLMGKETGLVTKTMIVPDKEVGCIIGHKFDILKSFEKETGAKIKISHRNGDEDRIITIRGSKACVDAAENKICQALHENKENKRLREISRI